MNSNLMRQIEMIDEKYEIEADQPKLKLVVAPLDAKAERLKMLRKIYYRMKQNNPKAFRK